MKHLIASTQSCMMNACDMQGLDCKTKRFLDCDIVCFLTVMVLYGLVVIWTCCFPRKP